MKFRVLLPILLVAASSTPGVAQGVKHQNQRSEQAAQLLSAGVEAFSRDDVANAEKFFQQALAVNPNDSTAHTYLGIIADRNGNLAEARRHFAAATSIDPRSPSAKNNYGAILLKLGRPVEASEQFEASLRLDKNQPNALVNLAQIRLARGTPADLNSAEEMFGQAYALAPDLEIARALVVVALRRHDKDAASRHYTEYSAHLDGANSAASASAARSELGAALLEEGLTREALLELKAAVAGDPANSDSIVRLAKAYLTLNDVPGAGRTLEAAVARGQVSAPIYALLSAIYEKSGHYENAIPAMRLAIQTDPKSEVYRFSYGMLLTRALAPDAAVIRLNEAIQLFPNSSRLWLALGIAHFKAGRNDEAAKSYVRSLEIDPKFAVASAYLGMTYVETGQYAAALKYYEQALASNPKLGIVDYLIADVMQKDPVADNALIERHLVRAVELEPTFSLAHLSLGKSYSRNNRLSDALHELEQVVKLDPNLAETYYQLGRVYNRLKREEEAKVALAKFKELSDTQKEQALKDRKDIVARLANVLF